MLERKFCIPYLPCFNQSNFSQAKEKTEPEMQKLRLHSVYLARPKEFESPTCRLGVWHTTSYGIMPDDFQNLKNLETTGFFGRSPYYSVPSGTTLFLLILYRPISKLLASQGPNSSQRYSDTLCKSIMIGGWEVNPQT